MHYRSVRNNNKRGGYSISLAEFSLKVISNTTIDGLRGDIGDNLWEAMSIFLVEGNIRTSGDTPLGENHIIIGGCFGVILDTYFRERGSDAWG